MEQKINIAELLKDCPKGMELDCTMYDNVTLIQVQEDNIYPIKIETPDGSTVLTKYGGVSYNKLSKCIIFPKGETNWEGFVPPCEFKDGDVLVHTQNGRFIMSIYKSNENEKLINTHVIFWDREEGLSVGMQICCYTDNVRFATEEEKKKLFQTIKDNGYRWNPETKTLERLIPNKFDITTLKPFDKVLMRSSNAREWVATFYSHYSNNKFYGCGMFCDQCIPYEGNEYLRGTTNDCDEYFKNW